MNMLILFPSDYFNPKQVDEVYKTEYKAVCQLPEFNTALFDYDKFVQGEPLKIYPQDFYRGGCIYRGWMLTPPKYADLYEYLNKRGIQLINSCCQYTLCHCFPVVYPEIKAFTPTVLNFTEAINWEQVL